MRSEEELRKVIKISLEEGDIINVSFLEIVWDEREHTLAVQLFGQDMLDILEKNPQKKFKVLADVTSIPTARYLSGDSRKVYFRLARHDQVLKIAVVGVNPVMRATINLMLMPSGKQIRFFADKDKARAWLTENKNTHSA